MDMEPYIDLDSNLLVCSELKDANIIDNLMTARNSVETAELDDNEKDDDEPDRPQPSVTEALEVCDTLCRFFVRSEHSLNVLCEINKNP